MHSELTSRLPTGAHIGKTVSPQAVRHLPAAVHAAYAAAIAAALHPVFVVAALISVIAFVLTWFLKETPLRQTVRPLDGEELTPAAAAEGAPPATG